MLTSNSIRSKAKQPALIYSLLWCDTWSLKCFHSNKNADPMETNMEVSKFTVCPHRPPPSPPPPPTCPPKTPQHDIRRRGRWAARNSRENKRAVSIFPRERCAEALANHSPLLWREAGLEEERVCWGQKPERSLAFCLLSVRVTQAAGRVQRYLRVKY